jgi:hypothetical protein
MVAYTSQRGTTHEYTDTWPGRGLLAQSRPFQQLGTPTHLALVHRRGGVLPLLRANKLDGFLRFAPELELLPMSGVSLLSTAHLSRVPRTRVTSSETVGALRHSWCSQYLGAVEGLRGGLQRGGHSMQLGFEGCCRLGLDLLEWL